MQVVSHLHYLMDSETKALNKFRQCEDAGGGILLCILLSLVHNSKFENNE